MSWASKGSVNIKRERLQRLGDRTEATVLPTVEDIFANADELEPEFVIDIVDKIYFSNFPGAKEGGAAALRGFLTNQANVDVLKSTGAVGAVIEMFHRMDISKNFKSAHGQNLLPTLHLLSIGDTKVQRRMLANTHTLPILLQLCRVTAGTTQVMAFEILDAMSYLDGCLDKLIALDVLPFLFSYEMMHRKSTEKRIKHMAVAMVHRITVKDVGLFPVHLFEEVVLDDHRRRRIDGHMEVHLLSSFLMHIEDKVKRGEYLENEFKLFPHMIGEVLHEEFEDLDHMVQILKCVLIQVVDQKQADWMLESELTTCLQLIVKTNYQLLRRKAGAMNQVKVQSPVKTTGKSKKKDDRTIPTKMALALVRPEKTAASKSDDINFTTTKIALEIYQEILKHRPEIIANLVSSGLIPALLFRVGNGPETDWRFNKLVVNFVYLIMMQVADAQPDVDMLIPLIPIQGKLSFYATLDFEADESRAAQKLVESLRAKVASYKDLRLVSNTMAAHGLTNCLLASIFRHEEPDIMVKSLRCLAIIKFSAISDRFYNPDIMLRLVSLSQRHDCFYSCLSIMLDAALYPDIEGSQLDDLMKTMVLPVLIRGFSTTGWMFKMKARVYRAVAVMSQHPNFKDQLLDCEGMGTMLTMLHIKKKLARSKRRNSDGGEDDSTEQLLKVLRQDWAMSRIQSFARTKLVRLHPKKKKEPESP